MIYPGTGDTIVARATPRGASAMSIIRLSGAKAIEIAAGVFEGHDLLKQSTHTAHVGFVQGDQGAIDQIVATLFLAPNSATGEDIVEFSCHGGDVATDTIIELLTSKGARHAEPGEYTLRSFLNGKIDLAQAEGIAELIHARSERAGRISLAHLRGRYSDELSEIRSKLIELVSLIELELDFSEEDVAFADRSRLVALLDEAEARIHVLLNSYQYGKALSEGIRVVIAGRPNAGKSTLLNAIVGYDRVIVNEKPGTTRDEVESEVEFEGVRFQFVDTAGLRETEDEVEAEGVRRSYQSLAGADLVVEVIDLTDRDGGDTRLATLIKLDHPDLPVLRVGNKVDLMNGQDENADDLDMMIAAVQIGQDETALNDLMKQIAVRTVGSDTVGEEHQVVTSSRQQSHLRAASDSTARAKAQLSSGASGDMLSSDIRQIIEEIGAITGEITNEDILDQIFSKFCIGK